VHVEGVVLISFMIELADASTSFHSISYMTRPYYYSASMYTLYMMLLHIILQSYIVLPHMFLLAVLLPLRESACESDLVVQSSETASTIALSHREIEVIDASCMTDHELGSACLAHLLQGRVIVFLEPCRGVA
jgi:hypothetical protein